jgi:hypothetical protein
MITILAAIFNQPGPGSASFQDIPHIRECLRRHVRMADDIVCLPKQFTFSEAANVEKNAIDVGYLPLQVSRRDYALPGTEQHFLLRNWQIGFHLIVLINRYVRRLKLVPLIIQRSRQLRLLRLFPPGVL